MNKLHNTITGSIRSIQIAGEYAADPGGALDEATEEMKDINESELESLLTVENRFSGRHEFRIEDAQHHSNMSGLLLPTGYIGVVEASYKGDIAYALFSMTGGLDPDNEVQQTVNSFEDRFCIAAMALAKSFREKAYIQRSPLMRRLSRTQWGIEKRGEPLTLGWGSHGRGVYLGASGFMPGPNLVSAIGHYPEISGHIASEPDETKAFGGSGLCDECAIGGINRSSWAGVVGFAHQKLEEGASLN